MTTDKFMYLCGFTSVNEMSLKQKLAYYRTSDEHLKAIGKWASNVLMHSVSTTIEDKINGKPESKYSYQLMLMQHLSK